MQYILENITKSMVFTLIYGNLCMYEMKKNENGKVNFVSFEGHFTLK